MDTLPDRHAMVDVGGNINSDLADTTRNVGTSRCLAKIQDILFIAAMPFRQVRTGRHMLKQWTYNCFPVGMGSLYQRHFEL